MRKKAKLISGSAGFTLIELIVVIAIIAILGGIGTVGYSAYVDRANRAADESMISDIEQALIMGAYSKNYAPGSTVGAVAVSKGGDATESQDDFDGNGTNDIDEMMINAFGTNWREELQLKSDHFHGSDSAKIIEAMKAAQKADGTSIFDSVPDSSFYKTAGNTDALVSDVDDIASALHGVLGGVGGYAFSMFWGEDFHNSVQTGGLGDTWNTDDQMAANLTVFAAANQITGADSTRMEGWVNSWTGNTVDVSSSNDGYVADLVMQYAQCVAMRDYVKNTGNDREIGAMEGRYRTLEKAMAALANPTNGYVTDFNAAMDEFWKGLEKDRTEWQESGQAEKDAEALLASMTALNSLEGTYVNKDQTDLLKSNNAFAAAGAADVLDTMVNYASMSSLPDGDYVIALTIGPDGTPVITPTLQTE